ncbi:MAG: MBL fold metallo-hydrolase [Deltaproteobacteria bacterium]
MHTIEIMEDFFFIQRGYLNGNHFVYRSADPLLIDTAYIGDFDATEQSITNLGVDLSRVRQIITTHAHCDHVGGNKIIQDRSGCDIAMHRIGKYFMDIRDDWATWWRYYDQEADFFDCTRPLDDGDLVSIGPHEFQVIYTPGHASDGIVLYSPREKILLSSDTLWENDMPAITVRVEGSRAVFSLLESIEKIEKLDVKVVYPGHGRPFTDVPSAISSAKRRVSRFFENPKRIGNGVLRKIIIYTLMMKRTVQEDAFFAYLMGTPWFEETVDLYFNSAYEKKYHQVMHDFFQRGIVKRRDGSLYTTVKP